jgi:peroxiredoxin
MRIGDIVRACFVLLATFLSTASTLTQTTVTGKVTGSEGKPMLVATVILSQLPDLKPVESVGVSSKGEFEFTIDTNGIWMLQFTGVHHQEHDVALYVDRQKKVGLNVQLAAYDYLGSFDAVKVTGNFNNWYPLSASPMQKQSDGTYTAEIETKVDSLVYQLMYVRRGDACEGTQADRYASNASGSYNSIVAATHGKVRIVFDPRKLLRSDKPAKVSFSNSESTTSKFARIYDEFRHYQDTYQSAFKGYMKTRDRSGHFSFDWSGAVSSIENQLKNETNSLLREELYMNYLSLAVIKKTTDTSFYRTVLKNIPPTSPIWLLDPHSMYYALNHAAFTEQQRDSYVLQVINGNPVARIKSVLLFDEFHVAKYSGKPKKAAEYYYGLVSQLGDTPEAERIQRSYPHEIDLMIGRPVPAFSVVSMRDSTKTYDNGSFKGSYYLMDFWATTGKQCIREMENLHDAYRKFKAKNFEMLSLSVDSTYETVVKFRQGKWKMPWLHAFLGSNPDNKVVTDFQVITVPKRYLIGPDGNLVAMGKDLDGSRLEQTLKKYLGK